LDLEKTIDVAKLKKALTLEITKEISAYFRELRRQNNYPISETTFNLQVKATISKVIDLLPLQIQQGVTESVLLTYDKPTSDIAKDLSAKIEQSVRKTEILLSETLTKKVREKNNEVFLKAEEKGDKYLFSHVVDSKNAPFCADYGNELKTREEWENIKSDIFIEGGHFGCRGIMVLVKEDEIDEVLEEVEVLYD
jgi:hypothetical protein